MLKATEFYPWHKQIASEWLATQNRFSHAWLIHGMAGTGKQQFALAAASSLLCINPVNNLACGKCQACMWVLNGNHPDVKRIRPDSVALAEVESGLAIEELKIENKSPSQEIRIDQLRQLGDWFNTATHSRGWRVAVLYPAQRLNMVTANALLKILEEPPANTVFLLVADSPDRLLPTIVSRCRKLPLPVPEQTDSIAWLQGQGIEKPEQWLAATSNAPVHAFKLSKVSDQPYPEWLNGFIAIVRQNSRNPDVRELAQQLEKINPLDWIDPLQRLFIDLSLWNQGLQGRYFPSLPNAKAIGESALLKNISAGFKSLGEQRAVAAHPLNAKLHTHSSLQQAILALHTYLK